MAEGINWIGGEGPTNPNSEQLKAQIIPPTPREASVGADIWAGQPPKGEAPINENIEVGKLDEKAGALTVAHQAVMQGAAMAFSEVPSDINKCQYEAAGGGIFQIVDNGRVVGYSAEAAGDVPEGDITFN